MKNNANENHIREQVRTRYSKIVRGEAGSCCNSSCCTPSPLGDSNYSIRLGYSSDELSAVPEGANMGLGCGNPQAIAEIKEGEIVLDLGCGGGFDCFLAIKKVGEKGNVIGVDMTPEMIAKARENALQGNHSNVEFRLGEIEHLPVADQTVDVIISNCVINLSPNKEQVFKEAYRVLKPSGRLAISDIVAITPLPNKILEDMDAHCGCVAGATLVSEIEKMLRHSGFSKISIEIKENSKLFIRDWFPESGMENFVRSAFISAIK